MVVTAQSMRAYRDRLSAISKKAAYEVQKYMLAHGYQIDEAFIEFAYQISTKYGEAAGALSCQFYDNLAEYWRAIEGGSRFIQPALPAETASVGEVAKTVIGTAKKSEFEVPGAISRLVKRTAEDTTLHNAIRDRAEWAWIPHGDTCPFCLMLASNGWQEASKAALAGGHASHIHSNCDCTYAVRFDKRSGVAGYDPEKYANMYQEADGSRWQDKVNAMRREQYAQNSEKINEQKRIAYHRRQELKNQQEGTPSG